MEEVKKKKTTAKKVEKEEKVAKTTKKETVKKAAPKKEAKKVAVKEEKKTTTKKAAPKTTAKKAATKKEAVNETPKKETKATAKKETVKKAVAKTTTKKTTAKEKKVEETIGVVETAIKNKRVSKRNTNKPGLVAKRSFVPDEADIANYMANKDEIDEEIFAKQVYDSTFDYFYGEPYIGAELKFDPSWETTANPAVREKFALAKEDAIRIRQAKAEKENSTRKLSRQVEIDEYSLVTEIATTLHNNWCDNEIREYFERAKVAKGNFSQGIENILNAACYKKGKKTNEISINREAFETNKDALVSALDDFELFKTLVGKDNTYVVEVRKYAKRNLDAPERQEDFKASTGEENILRPYEELSMRSKSENIAAAGRAVDAYKELASAGITLDEMKNNADARVLAGKIMHIGYLEDNKDDKTYFNDLSSDIKDKDLMVFDTLIGIVENAREYTLYPVEGVTLPDYDQIEKDVINGVANHFVGVNKKATPVVQPKSAYEVEKMIEAMEKGVDVLGEGQEEKPKINTMGYVGVWMTAIATAGLTAAIFAMAAFYLG